MTSPPRPADGGDDPLRRVLREPPDQSPPAELDALIRAAAHRAAHVEAAGGAKPARQRPAWVWPWLPAGATLATALLAVLLITASPRRPVEAPVLEQQAPAPSSAAVPAAPAAPDTRVAPAAPAATDKPAAPAVSTAPRESEAKSADAQRDRATSGSAGSIASARRNELQKSEVPQPATAIADAPARKAAKPDGSPPAAPSADAPAGESAKAGAATADAARTDSAMAGEANAEVAKARQAAPETDRLMSKQSQQSAPSIASSSPPGAPVAAPNTYSARGKLSADPAVADTTEQCVRDIERLQKADRTADARRLFKQCREKFPGHAFPPAMQKDLADPP